MLKRSLKWKEAEHVFLLEVDSNKEYSNDNVAETSNNCYSILERCPPCGEST